jgi:hypothetical protein
MPHLRDTNFHGAAAWSEPSGIGGVDYPPLSLQTLRTLHPTKCTNSTNSMKKVVQVFVDFVVRSGSTWLAPCRSASNYDTPCRVGCARARAGDRRRKSNRPPHSHIAPRIVRQFGCNPVARPFPQRETPPEPQVNVLELTHR